MYVNIHEREQGQKVNIYVANGEAAADITMPTDRAVAAFAALVQGRKVAADISFMNDKGTALFIHMGLGNYATVPLSDSWRDEFSKALARLACILTDTDTTEGE
jgi:hypothetical protein